METQIPDLLCLRLGPWKYVLMFCDVVLKAVITWFQDVVQSKHLVGVGGQCCSQGQSKWYVWSRVDIGNMAVLHLKWKWSPGFVQLYAPLIIEEESVEQNATGNLFPSLKNC